MGAPPLGDTRSPGLPPEPHRRSSLLHRDSTRCGGRGRNALV